MQNKANVKAEKWSFPVLLPTTSYNTWKCLDKNNTNRMSLFLRTFISNSLSREMLNFSTFTESQNQLGWKGLPRNIHSTTGQPKYVLWMYNKLPLLWRTNKSILILYIESCTRITATSFLYSWGAQWMSALTYLSQEVWAYYSAKFPTYFFQLLKRNIPQGMNEGLTTFISVFQNATSSVGEFFLTRSGHVLWH